MPPKLRLWRSRTSAIWGTAIRLYGLATAGVGPLSLGAVVAGTANDVTFSTQQLENSDNPLVSRRAVVAAIEASIWSALTGTPATEGPPLFAIPLVVEVSARQGPFAVLPTVATQVLAVSATRRLLKMSPVLQPGFHWHAGSAFIAQGWGSLLEDRYRSEIATLEARSNQAYVDGQNDALWGDGLYSVADRLADLHYKLAVLLDLKSNRWTTALRTAKHEAHLKMSMAETQTLRSVLTTWEYLVNRGSDPDLDVVFVKAADSSNWDLVLTAEQASVLVNALTQQPLQRTQRVKLGGSAEHQLGEAISLIFLDAEMHVELPRSERAQIPVDISSVLLALGSFSVLSQTSDHQARAPLKAVLPACVAFGVASFLSATIASPNSRFSMWSAAGISVWSSFWAQPRYPEPEGLWEQRFAWTQPASVAAAIAVGQDKPVNAEDVTLLLLLGAGASVRSWRAFNGKPSVGPFLLETAWVVVSSALTSFGRMMTLEGMEAERSGQARTNGAADIRTTLEDGIADAAQLLGELKNREEPKLLHELQSDLQGIVDAVSDLH